MTNKERNKAITNFAELDKIVNGVNYVIPSKGNDLRMYDLRMYCKAHNIKPENLTKDEVDKFRINN